MKRKKPAEAVIQSSTSPILLLVGTISTESSKDAMAYAKGLAEAQVVAKDAAFLQIVRRHPGQYLYEIHEGGDGRSLLPVIDEMLSREPGQALIPLEGARVALIREEAGELVTLINQPDPSAHESAMGDFLVVSQGLGLVPRQLHPLCPTGEIERKASTYLLLAATVFTLFTGAWQTLKNDSIDVRRLSFGLLVNKAVAQTSMADMPALKLQEAKSSLQAPGAYLSYVRYRNNKWEWAQTSAGASIDKPAPPVAGALPPPVPPGVIKPIAGAPLSEIGKAGGNHG
jgi:hypothetical protein